MPVPSFRDQKPRRGESIVRLSVSEIRTFAFGMFLLVLAVFIAGFAAGRYTFGSSDSVHAAPDDSPIAPAAEIPEDLPEGATAVSLEIAPDRETPSPQSPSPRKGKKFAIVVQSIPVGENSKLAEENANSYLRHLRSIGFKEARVESVEVPDRGRFLRVIAMEALYPSVTVANNDIAAMRRRGEISSGFPILLESER